MSPSNERSAEWLRGRVSAMRDYEWAFSPDTITREVTLLAAAEAREAGEHAANRLRQAAIMASEPAASDLRAGATAIEAITTQPTAAEVIEACRVAFFRIYWDHEDVEDMEQEAKKQLAAIARWQEANGGN